MSDVIWSTFWLLALLAIPAAIFLILHAIFGWGRRWLKTTAIVYAAILIVVSVAAIVIGVNDDVPRSAFLLPGFMLAFAGNLILWGVGAYRQIVRRYLTLSKWVAIGGAAIVLLTVFIAV